MRMKKIIICTVFSLGFVTRAVMAECTLNSDYNYPLTLTLATTDRIVATNSSGLNYGVATLSTVASQLGISSDTILATCTSGETLIAENNETSILSAIYNNYFSTTVPGFGVRFSIGGNANGINIPTGGGTSFTLSSSGSYSLRSIFDSVVSQRIYYSWRSSEDTPAGGNVAVGALMIRVITSDGKELLRVYYDSFNVIVGSCRVNTSDKEVDFGTVSTRTLKVAGSTGKEANFNINLYCSSAKREPSITFEGSTDSAYTTVFTNPSGEEYAQGVGVQLLKDGNVIIPGGEVPLKVAGSGSSDYEFSSRVFRLNDELTVGAIDIPVTFIMTYE